MTTASPAFSSVDQPPELNPRERARAEGRRRAAEQREQQRIAEAAAEVAKGNGKVEPLVPVTAPKVRKGRERDLLDGKAEYKLVPVGDLHRDEDQPRKTFRDIHLLAGSLQEMGMLQPITARIGPDNKLIIMWGERRWKAVQVLSQHPDPEVSAAWQYVPTIIRYGVQDTGLLAKQLMENRHRDDMDPLDEARAIRRIMRDEKIATYAEVAKRLGYSLTWVTNRVALLNLDENDQERVSSGELGITVAAQKARIKVGNTRKSITAPDGHRTLPHFSEDHFLAGRARARCNAQARASDHFVSKIGGVACGACWEVVIRQDARRNPDLQAGEVNR